MRRQSFTGGGEGVKDRKAASDSDGADAAETSDVEPNWAWSDKEVGKITSSNETLIKLVKLARSSRDPRAPTQQTNEPEIQIF